MIIDIPQDLALRLEELAKEQGSTVEDLLRGLVDQEIPKRQRTTLADLAEIAVSAGLASDKPVDTAERSREILNAEFADRVDRRIRG